MATKQRRSYHKFYMYCIVRDGKTFAYSRREVSPGKYRTAFNQEYATIFASDPGTFIRTAKRKYEKGEDHVDITNSTSHPNKCRLFEIALKVYHKIKQPGDRFVVLRVNSKECPFDVNFRKIVQKGAKYIEQHATVSISLKHK